MVVYNRTRKQPVPTLTPIDVAVYTIGNFIADIAKTGAQNVMDTDAGKAAYARVMKHISDTNDAHRSSAEAKARSMKTPRRLKPGELQHYGAALKKIMDEYSQEQ